jgi:RimJ/RimL family protein N-acetyltransferase
VQATVFTDNPASRRVLEKLGFAPVGEPYPLFSLGRSGSSTAVRLRWRGQLGTDSTPQELAA